MVHRAVSPSRFQLSLIDVDGSGEMQLTDTPGLNGFPNWSEVPRRRPSEVGTPFVRDWGVSVVPLSSELYR